MNSNGFSRRSRNPHEPLFRNSELCQSERSGEALVYETDELVRCAPNDIYVESNFTFAPCNPHRPRWKVT